jgi:uncharacterized protein YprB with RNaseH-like and TPR domain
MSMRNLAARLRDIVRQDPKATAQPTTRELTYVPGHDGEDPDRSKLADRLGGRAIGGDGACIALDYVYAGDRSYGRRAVEAWRPAGDGPLHLIDPRASSVDDWARRIVFFDIETTGLSGGAGTIAFLVGCGWFDDEGFRVRQFFVAGPAGERAMLDALGDVLADASLLVTFNGRTFDVPFMEMRWAFHRAAPATDDLPHVDMLPAARRLWRRREVTSALEGGCNLTSLERAVLDVHRVGDVPGFEIPARYFHFLRTGDQPSVEPVLEHNRRDLVSLAALLSHALWLVAEGPEACREPGEQLALGRLYERAGDHERARQSFEMAARGVGDPEVRREALARLATSLRREARYDEAAQAWEGLLAVPRRDGASALDAMANQALAVHHEHRRRDLAAARRYAAALEQQVSPRARGDVDHRIKRIDRKLGHDKGVGSLFS